jgi:hypothetical protein
MSYFVTTRHLARNVNGALASRLEGDARTLFDRVMRLDVKRITPSR